MKKLLLAATLIAAMGITGCLKDPQSSKTVGNGIKVEFLFEHDGIKVYRFYDGGYTHYFTDRGETSTTIREGNNQRQETIK